MRPLAQMPSTTSTSRPSMGSSRSFLMRTTPEALPSAYGIGRDEVDGGGDADLTHQVGDEQAAPLSTPIRWRLLAGIVTRDLGAEARHLLLDRRLVEQHLAEAVGAARHHENRVAFRNSRDCSTSGGSASPAASASSKHCEMVRTEWSV